MITRIVKLHIIPNEEHRFVDIFARSKDTISSMDGCHYVSLVRDSKDEQLYFTISHWESEEALDNYRNSAFFKSIWPQTKSLLSQKAEAWSMITLDKASPKE